MKTPEEIQRDQWYTPKPEDLPLMQERADKIKHSLYDWMKEFAPYALANLYANDRPLFDKVYRLHELYTLAKSPSGLTPSERENLNKLQKIVKKPEGHQMSTEEATRRLMGEGAQPTPAELADFYRRNGPARTPEEMAKIIRKS